MSNWLVHLPSGKSRNISYRELCEGYQSREFNESTPVRQDSFANWQPLETVPGIGRFRPVDEPQTHKPQESPSNQPKAATTSKRDAEARKTRGGEQQRSANQRTETTRNRVPQTDTSATEPPNFRSTGPQSALTLNRQTMIILTVIIAGGLAWGFWPETWPDPSEHSSKQLSIESVLPPAPSSPSVAITKFQAVPLPGLEEEAGLDMPSLTPDLLHVVAARWSGSGRGLYLASRSSSLESFSKPRRLSCCPGQGAFPALSHDGRGLLFTVRGAPNRLFCATAHDSFESSRQVELKGDGLDGMHLDNAQWIDDEQIRIAVSDMKYTKRRHVIAVRETEDPCVFRVKRPVSFPNPWPRYNLSTDLKRAYYQTKGGPQLTSPMVGNRYLSLTEGAVTSEFQPGDAVTESSVWVAPAEDVLCLEQDGVLCFWRFR